MAKILSGTWVRDEILKESKPRVDRLRELKRPPGIAVILAGIHEDYEIYVRNKVNTRKAMRVYS